jgi:hypothetical protein
MAQTAHNVIQHDFGFPRIVRDDDAEIAALYGLLVSLGATKMMAEQVIEAFPRHERACRSIVRLASDSEGDISGVIALLEDWDSWQRRRDRAE